MLEIRTVMHSRLICFPTLMDGRVGYLRPNRCCEVEQLKVVKRTTKVWRFMRFGGWAGAVGAYTPLGWRIGVLYLTSMASPAIWAQDQLTLFRSLRLLKFALSLWFHLYYKISP